MPKIVDHDQRREELVDALWRVVTRDGVSAVTVRSVAKEAGVPPGLLCYYFADRAALLASAVDRHTGQAERKAARLLAGDVDIDTAVEILMLTVPHTATRRQQSGIWLLLIAERDWSRSNDELLKELDRRVSAGILAGLKHLRRRGLVHRDRDLDLETVRLHGLIDGLSLHSTTDPRRMTAPKIRAVLRDHVGDLGRAPR